MQSTCKLLTEIFNQIVSVAGSRNRTASDILCVFDVVPGLLEILALRRPAIHRFTYNVMRSILCV